MVCVGVDEIVIVEVSHATQHQHQQQQQQSSRRSDSAASTVPGAGLLGHIRTAAMLFVVTLVFMLTFAPAFLLLIIIIIIIISSSASINQSINRERRSVRRDVITFVTSSSS